MSARHHKPPPSAPRAEVLALLEEQGPTAPLVMAAQLERKAETVYRALALLREAGLVTVAGLAPKLGRRPQGAAAQLWCLVGEVRAVAGMQTRACLRCRQAFASHGPGNRLCEPCGAYAAEQPLEHVGVGL